MSTLLIVLVEPSWLFIDMDRLSLGGDEIDETAGEVFNVFRSETYLKNLKFLSKFILKLVLHLVLKNIIPQITHLRVICFINFPRF